MKVNLDKFNNTWYSPRRGLLIRALWHIVNALLLQNHLNTSSRLKVAALKIFGAKVGKGVVVKPGVNVKYPWNLEIGNHSWIGENAWLDSLAIVKIGANVCISQGAYICTGNHDWTDASFALLVKPVTIEDGAWIGARAMVMPGVTVASHAVLTAGTVLTRNAEPYFIYAGVPAIQVKERIIK